jgi:TonB-linked SusC/RagA family outer membrane protein
MIFKPAYWPGITLTSFYSVTRELLIKPKIILMKKIYSNYCTSIDIHTAAVMKKGALVLALLCLFIQLAHAQTIAVTGMVKGSDGLPLPGATVKIKGTTTIVVTNQDGIYRVIAPSKATVLVFSFIGTTTVEQAVGNQIRINVTLADENKGLNEVVVLGYTNAKRKDLTGAVATVNMEDALKAPVGSIDNALAGRVAGLVVTGNDGQPGQANNITVRGYGSITQDASPLFVIDGFPLEAADFNSLSPQDIESISVLKDASSTAIYGSRGANGVVIVTTKRGKVGTPVVSYNFYYALQAVPKLIPLMDSYNFIKFQLELSSDSNLVNGPAQKYLFQGTGLPGNVPRRTIDYYQNFPTTRLADYYFKTSPAQNHDISMRGGTDATQYSISGNFYDLTGAVVNTGFKRSQARFVLDQKLSDAVKVGFNVNYAYTKSYGAQVGAQLNASYQTPIANIYKFNPTAGANSTVAFDPLTDLDENPDNPDSQTYNPLVDAQNILYNTFTNNLVANAYGQVRITKNLLFKSTAGLTKNALENDQFYNANTLKGNQLRYGHGVNGSISNVYLNVFLNENTLSFNKIFDGGHTLNLLGGFSETTTNTKNYGLQGSQLPNTSEGLDGLEEAPTGQSSVTASSSSRNFLASYFVSGNYNYKERYLLTANFRADGSSKFSPANRWGYFPSAAVAWRVSNEAFMKDIKVINDLKFRASYGAIGNNRIGDFSQLPQFSFPTSYGYTYNNANVAGAAVSNFGNPDLKWETVLEKDLGVDITLLNNRIQFTADAYRRTTSNLLLNAQIPYTTGLANSFINVGSIQNQGLEFTLNTVNIQSKTFRWASNFNISFNSNKVLGLSNGSRQLLTSLSWDDKYGANAAYIAQVGQPVSQFYGLIFDGVYQYSDFDKLPSGAYLLKPGLPGNGNTNNALIKPGDIRYKDINGDGKIDSHDFTIIGNALPLHTGGFSNNFTFHNFDLNVFFQWSYGGQIEDASRYMFEGNGRQGLGVNQWASYENRWEPDNPSNTLFRAGGQGIQYYYSTRVIEDGSYLRLKTVSLGYSLPKNLLSRIKLKSARLYVSAQNLITWTNYQGPDPEVSARNSTLTQGFDYTAYPHARTTTFGINISL